MAAVIGMTFFLSPIVAASAEGEDRRYEFIDALCDRALSPRLLTPLDIADLIETDPLAALVSPEGDFNGDGVKDMAISGLYQLPSPDRRYFLLVATRDPKSNRPRKLYFEEGSKPYFLFQPGDTGAGDPKTQAFSMSHCVGCAEGVDFVWDKKTGKPVATAWAARIVHGQKFIEAPVVPVAQEHVDRALQLVGALPDVVGYVQKLQKKNKRLGARVEAGDTSDRVRVFIYEKREKADIAYKNFLVDLEKNTVISEGR